MEWFDYNGYNEITCDFDADVHYHSYQNDDSDKDHSNIQRLEHGIKTTSEM